MSAHTHDEKLGVEFGSKLITIPEEDKVVKLQCAFRVCHTCAAAAAAHEPTFPYHNANSSIHTLCRLGHGGNRILPFHHAFLLPRCCGLPSRLRRDFAAQYILSLSPSYPITDADAGDAI